MFHWPLALFLDFDFGTQKVAYIAMLYVVLCYNIIVHRTPVYVGSMRFDEIDDQRWFLA